MAMILKYLFWSKFIYFSQCEFINLWMPKEHGTKITFPILFLYLLDFLFSFLWTNKWQILSNLVSTQLIRTDFVNLNCMWWLLADVLRWLAGNSSRTLDIMAQYWQLIAHPDDLQSGDYGYSKADMQRFGASEGFGVYKAIENAADHNVSIR